MRGFTLIETLVVAVIFSLIIGAIFGVMNIANVSFPTDTGLLDLGQQARQVMLWITRETREASSATITVINANSDSISFNTPNETGIQYYLSGNQVIREYPAGTVKIVGNYITRLKFTKTGSLLDVQLRADKIVLLRPLSFSLREQVRLRNE